MLVIGSGAGGAPTAALLAEAGFDVLVVEEGPYVEQGEVVPFSLDQMDRQYRAGGVTVALGFPTIAYTEGCCAGGGTEINSGLYRRPPEDVLDRWRSDHDVADLESDELDQHLRRGRAGALRADACPATHPGQRGAAPRRRRPRLAPRRDPPLDGLRPGAQAIDGRRQSMTADVPAPAAAAGARLLADHRVDRLVLDGGRATRAARHRPGRQPGHDRLPPRRSCAAAPSRRPACCSAPACATASVRTLAVHPTVKLAARFPDPVNVADDVPVHQVKEFAPDLSFGGSASDPGPRRARAQRLVDRFGPAIADWRRLAVYYAAITSEGRGRCAPLPGLRDPLVTYRLTRRDRALLGQGLARLALLMLEAGATEVYPSFRGAPVVRRRSDLAAMQARFARAGQRDDRPSVLHRADGRGRPAGRRQLRPRARDDATSASTTPRCCPTHRASTRRRR